MPIFLEDIQLSSANVVYTPKFFHKKLTGRGKKTGLITEYLNPRLKNLTKEDIQSPLWESEITKDKFGGKESLYLPIHPIELTKLKDLKNLFDHNVACYPLLATKKHPHFVQEIRGSLTIESLIVEETPKVQGGYDKKLIASYRLTTYCHKDTNKNDTPYQAIGMYGSLFPSNIKTFNVYTATHPQLIIEQFKKDATASGYTINQDVLDKLIQDFDLYEAICDQSEHWQNDIDEIVNDLLRSYKEDLAQCTNERDKEMLYLQIEGLANYLETYSIPLDGYVRIYKVFESHFSKSLVTRFSKFNLNLLLANTLDDLNNKKDQLKTVTKDLSALPQTSFKWSKEQIEAITTDAPLTLVQAGAGVGKSTCILGRIDYMENRNIDSEKVTVLSFTNAAADHIKHRNPKLNSMTIAKMIHTIYETNFPNQQLSTIDTIINSLDIYYPRNDIAYEFRKHLLNIKRTKIGSYTTMNNFIEHNYDTIIRMLEAIGQTCLELEIIICYQKIDELKEPKEVETDYLIIDEVQDNSVFEFIYAIRYVNKHNASLYIVGDGSQTLYEFRASNPKALNTLEASGVFNIYKLQTNYRSNQNILDFANVALKDIEANQFANIQLESNWRDQVTEKSFEDHINVTYRELARIGDLEDLLPGMIDTHASEWIEECFDRKEQIAFIAHKRRHIYKIEKQLRDKYPDKKIINIMPRRNHSTTVFSEFIKKYWNEVTFYPVKNIDANIANAILSRLDVLVYDKEKMEPLVQKQLAEWRIGTKDEITALKLRYDNQTISLEELTEAVKESLLDYEIENNAVKQATLSALNEQNKDPEQIKSADIILSTIHSAKGLEFDNVFTLHQNDLQEAEDMKRMYYVAFTRAKNTEFILSVGTQKTSKLKNNYDLVLDQLKKKTQTQTP